MCRLDTYEASDEPPTCRQGNEGGIVATVVSNEAITSTGSQSGPEQQ